MDNNNQAFIKKLVFDPSFRQWVQFAAPDDTIRWEKFIAENADRVESINYAIATIKALQFSKSELSDQAIATEVRKIVSELKNNNDLSRDDAARVIKKIHPDYIWLKLTGVIIIGVLIGLSYYLPNHTHKPVHNYDYAGTNKMFDQEYINHSDTVETIILSDNSKVLLYSKSKLSCSVFNKNSKREVFLSGQAYFKVSKDPSKPFIVYTNKLITKVLGTSFIINSFPENNNASVEVKTGRVSIFKTTDFKDENKKPFELSGLIITPNQKVVYSENKDSFKRVLTTNPEIVNNSETYNRFVFKEMPLSKVFEILQSTYGINIVYDKETTAGCSLTASMEKESFYGKLDMICKVISGSYEIIDGNVIFSSKGCK